MRAFLGWDVDILVFDDKRRIRELKVEVDIASISHHGQRLELHLWDCGRSLRVALGQVALKLEEAWDDSRGEVLKIDLSWELAVA